MQYKVFTEKISVSCVALEWRLAWKWSNTNNHEKITSETSWCTLLIPANLVEGRKHRHALKPVVVVYCISTDNNLQGRRSSIVFKRAFTCPTRGLVYGICYRCCPAIYIGESGLIFLTMSLSVEFCSVARPPNGSYWRHAWFQNRHQLSGWPKFRHLFIPEVMKTRSANLNIL